MGYPEDESRAENISISNAYQEMEGLPSILTSIVWNYKQNVQKEVVSHNQNVSAINAKLEADKKAISDKLENAKREASAARETIASQLAELETKADAQYGAFQEAVDRLPRKKGSSTPAIGSDLTKVLEKIQNRKNEDYGKIRSSLERLMQQENRIFEEKVADAQSDYDQQLLSIMETYGKEIKEQNDRLEENKKALYHLAVAEILGYAPQSQRAMFEKLQANIPSNMNYTAAESMPEAVEMGYLELDLDQWADDINAENTAEPVLESIRSQYAFALKNQNGRTTLQFPFGRSFEDSRFNKFIEYSRADRREAMDYVRALEMRLFMSIPCGKLRVTMVDPVDLGSNFSMFSCLGDDDERIISTKIWSDKDRIKEQLRLLIEQIAHVNQDCLRKDFDNIVAYNKFVGKNAEPLQALFIADFPNHFDQEACDMLDQIVNSGPACGVYTVIASAIEDVADSELKISSIPQAMERIECRDGRFYCKAPNGFENTINPIHLPDAGDQEEIFEALINGIKTSDRIIIYFDEVTDQLTQHPEKWFQFADLDGIDVPIGLEGASRTVQIHLGGDLNTQHHALISGTTGSGKSTLLHTIIMSILLRYSPEDVQIYLLDFKRGVEFKTYADSKLPNFSVISLDTEPEFGEAVLMALDQEQSERSQEFHDKKCEDIESYNEIAEADLDDDIYKIPRIVLIIDEFHELFADPDSDIAKNSKKLLEQIVRQGRALGVHVILASQTLPDDLAKVYGLINNRVALQSTKASAQLILDTDNEAANSLTNVDPGKGIFNNGGGNKDANHPFRIAYFDSAEQHDLLEKIKQRQHELYGNAYADVKPRLLLSTIQDDVDNPLNRFVMTGELPRRLELGCPFYLGEEIAMVNEFAVRLTARRAQNLLVLGSDPKRAELIYAFGAMSILFNTFIQSNIGRLPDEPVITFFDFSQNNSFRGSRLAKNNLKMMNELIARFPHVIRVFGPESLLDGLSMLEEEQAGAQGGKKHYVIFAGLNRAKRLLDNDVVYHEPPMEQFKKLVKNGPEAGYNYIIWANEPDSFFEYYGDMINDFNYRLVYDLTEDEYKKAVRSANLTTGFGSNNVISYNPDFDNKKVRIYSKPLTSWFNRFMDRLEGIEPESEMEGIDFGGGEFDDEY